MQIRNNQLRFTALFFGLLPAMQLMAQQADPPAQGDQAALLDTINVTAERREQSAQDVPISIAAFSGARLEASGVSRLSELSQLDPSFRLTTNSQSAATRIAVRGVGSVGNIGIDPSVATFVDGIYVARPGALLGNMLDIEAVEVLRGPQGTLFGRNASMGLLNVRTAAPYLGFEANVGVEIGSDGKQHVEGVYNTQISEHAAIRVAAAWDKGDGTGRTLADNQRIGDHDERTIRVGYHWENDQIDWTVRWDHTQQGGDRAVTQEVLPQTVTDQARRNWALRLDPDGRTGPRVANLPDFGNPRDGKVNLYSDNNVDDLQQGLASDLAWSFGNGYKLRLLSGYRNWDNDQIEQDIIALPDPYAARVSHTESQMHSEELQLLSPSDTLLGGRLDFVTGLYYMNEDYASVEQINFLPYFCSVLIRNVAPAQAAVCAVRPQEAATLANFNQSIESAAAYAQANFKITETFGLTAGARYTTEQREGSYVQKLNNPVGAIIRSPETTLLDYDDSQATYRFAATWKPSDRLLGFATYSTGYKSGGFNSGSGTPALGQKRIVGPEDVDNYELGMKSTLGDGRVQLNATLFRTDINGYQDRSFDGLAFIVKNAGNLRQQGVELSSQFRVNDPLLVSFALTYLDSEFTDFKNGTGLPGFGGVQDLTGTRANYSPRLAGNLGAEYKGDFGDSGLHWSLRGDLSFTSEYNNGQTTDNNPQTIQPGYGLLNARYTLFGGDGGWQVSLYGTNLTDRRYCVNTSYQVLDGALGLRDTTTGGSVVRCALSEPLSYGVEARWFF